MGRMSRLVVWSVMGLSGLPLSAVNADWVSLTSPDVAAPRIEVIEPGPQHVILEFDLPGFETEELTIDGQAFTRIALPGYPPLLKEGWPELPTISRSLIVSDEGLPHGNIVARKLVEIPMDPVVPSKGNLPRTIDPGSVPYAMGSFYSGGTLYPELEFELTSPFILRDHRGVTVRIYPFRYDAQRGVLLVLQSLTLEIVTSGTGGTNVKQRVTRPAVDHQFQRIYDQFFLNSDSGAKYQPITDPGPMLVVCDDAFLGQITPFVVWKEQKGIPVDVVATSVVGGTVDGIQSAIDNRYYSSAGRDLVNQRRRDHPYVQGHGSGLLPHGRFGAFTLW